MAVLRRLRLMRGRLASRPAKHSIIITPLDEPGCVKSPYHDMKSFPAWANADRYRTRAIVRVL